MRSNLQIVLVSGILCICVFCSCTKKHTAEVDNETQSVADYALIQNEFLSLMAAVFNHANHTAVIGKTVQCDSLRLLSGDRNFTAPGHVTPLFSLDLDKPCTISGWDSKTRSGTVQVKITAPISQMAARITVFLAGYTVNGVTFSCDSIVLRNSAHNNDSTTFGATVINGRAVNDDFTIRYNVSGQIVAYPAQSSSALKNQVRYTGNASGTNRQGLNFSASAFPGSSEQKIRTCKYISSGVAEIIPSGFKERVLNYGDGSCNDDASYSVNNNTIAIKLK